MSPGQRALHEAIIRALQMVLNAWKRYLKDHDSNSAENKTPPQGRV